MDVSHWDGVSAHEVTSKVDLIVVLISQNLLLPAVIDFNRNFDWPRRQIGLKICVLGTFVLFLNELTAFPLFDETH